MKPDPDDPNDERAIAVRKHRVKAALRKHLSDGDYKKVAQELEGHYEAFGVFTASDVAAYVDDNREYAERMIEAAFRGVDADSEVKWPEVQDE